MGNSHQNTLQKVKKAATQHKPLGCPPSSATIHVHMKIPSPPDESQDNEREDVESDEDKLYRQQVSSDNGLDDDAVVRKPQAHHESSTSGEDQLRGIQIHMLHFVTLSIVMLSFQCHFYGTEQWYGHL